MLKVVADVLPIFGVEWDMVADNHLSFSPELHCTGDQLKKKFNKLSKSVVPTGDPSCPSSVRRAKAICQLIIEKTEGVTGSEDELFSPNDKCGE